MVVIHLMNVEEGNSALRPKSDLYSFFVGCYMCSIPFLIGVLGPKEKYIRSWAHTFLDHWILQAVASNMGLHYEINVRNLLPWLDQLCGHSRLPGYVN